MSHLPHSIPMELGTIIAIYNFYGWLIKQQSTADPIDTNLGVLPSGALVMIDTITILGFEVFRSSQIIYLVR